LQINKIWRLDFYLFDKKKQYAADLLEHLEGKKPTQCKNKTSDQLASNITMDLSRASSGEEHRRTSWKLILVDRNQI
jgi:hypothetical protein